MTTLSLENQFEVEKLKLYLEANPETAFELAIAHFEDYLELVQEYRKLENKQKSPSLPPIPTPSHGRLQTECDYLKRENQQLRQENKDLQQLICSLSNDSDDSLPDFIQRAINQKLSS